MTVRPTRPGEGRAVTRLIRDALPGPLCALSIWRSRRVHVYVEDCVRAPRRDTPVFFVLAKSRNEIVGAAQYQPCADGAFLNHICVAPAYQGRGLGSGLLRDGTKLILEGRRGAVVRLDVDPLNRRAADWYRRVGFRHCANTVWLVGDLTPSVDTGTVGGMAEAERLRKKFGFSRFRLTTTHGRYQIGRLPGPYFRLDNPQAWRDSAVHGSLTRIKAGNRLLVRGSEPVAGLEIIHSAQRLEANAETLTQPWKHQPSRDREKVSRNRVQSTAPHKSKLILRDFCGGACDSPHFLTPSEGAVPASSSIPTKAQPRPDSTINTAAKNTGHASWPRIQ